MLYQIRHQITYSYTQSVNLKPHTLRLRPRCDGMQSLHAFSLRVDPQPSGISEINDLDGGAIQVWFQTATQHLTIEASAVVETHRLNPYNFLLVPWATQLPIDYASSLATQLQPYLQPVGQAFDPTIVQLAQAIYQKVEGNTLLFLSTLNQKLYSTCEYVWREEGNPLLPGITWQQQRGSCRDIAVVFMEACRVVGLATRFVSGYQEGDLELGNHDLHAWVEVYLPGGGWQGYDPTLGLAVADRHVTLVANAFASYTTPVTGNFVPVEPAYITRETVQSQLAFEISIRRKNPKSDP